MAMAETPKTGREMAETLLSGQIERWGEYCYAEGIVGGLEMAAAHPGRVADLIEIAKARAAAKSIEHERFTNSAISAGEAN